MSLALADRLFYLSPDDVEQVMDAAVVARDSGGWLTFRDAGDRLVRVLISAALPVVIHEYDVSDGGPHDGAEDPVHWPRYDEWALSHYE